MVELVQKRFVLQLERKAKPMQQFLKELLVHYLPIEDWMVVGERLDQLEQVQVQVQVQEDELDEEDPLVNLSQGYELSEEEQLGLM